MSREPTTKSIMTPESVDQTAELTLDKQTLKDLEVTDGRAVRGGMEATPSGLSACTPCYETNYGLMHP
jgi:hypothetical protein